VGWRCYITNVIKEADYAGRWRGSPAERRRRAAALWAPVFEWELEAARPRLVVALGKTVRGILTRLGDALPFPRIKTLQHYAYVAHRPRGTQGPMHPDRVREYDAEFRRIAELRDELAATAPT
jgi:uracil-DNA glycosylase